MWIVAYIGIDWCVYFFPFAKSHSGLALVLDYKMIQPQFTMVASIKSCLNLCLFFHSFSHKIARSLCWCNHNDRLSVPAFLNEFPTQLRPINTAILWSSMIHMSASSLWLWYDCFNVSLHVQYNKGIYEQCKVELIQKHDLAILWVKSLNMISSVVLYTLHAYNRW